MGHGTPWQAMRSCLAAITNRPACFILAIISATMSAIQAGVATFNLSSRALGTGPAYVWIEFDSHIKNDNACSITLNLNNPGARKLHSWGSDGQTSSTIAFKNGGEWETRNAWYKLDELPSDMTLQITFHTAYNTGEPYFSYMDNLHVAVGVVPEPLSMVLFVFGGAPLAVGLRKRFRLS
jgi:hypothetical protein